MPESEVPTMQPEPSGLLTPIYHKTAADMPWPEDAVPGENKAHARKRGAHDAA